MNTTVLKNEWVIFFNNLYTEIIDKILLNNNWRDYLGAFILFLIIFLSIQLVRGILKVWVEKITIKTKTKIDDFVVSILDKKRRIFFLLASFVFAVKTLIISDDFRHILDSILFIAFIFEIAKVSINSVEFFFERYLRTRNKAKKAAYYAVINISRFLIWISAIMFILSNFNINVTSLATGFGVAGIAVAFAFQSILKDLFSYFTILLDHPVDVGDFINVDNKNGTVERVGIKTTRLRSLDGEEIIIPNASLAEYNIDNYGKANYKRVVMKIKVPLETKVSELKKMKLKLIEIVESFPNNKLIRCYMKEISNQDLEFELVYRISPRDYELYTETKEKVNFAILEYFEKEKIMFPYPAEIMINKEAGRFPGYYMNEDGDIVKKKK